MYEHVVSICLNPHAACYLEWQAPGSIQFGDHRNATSLRNHQNLPVIPYLDSQSIRVDCMRPPNQFQHRALRWWFCGHGWQNKNWLLRGSTGNHDQGLIGSAKGFPVKLSWRDGKSTQHNSIPTYPNWNFLIQDLFTFESVWTIWQTIWFCMRFAYSWNKNNPHSTHFTPQFMSWRILQQPYIKKKHVIRQQIDTNCSRASLVATTVYTLPHRLPQRHRFLLQGMAIGTPHGLDQMSQNSS